MDVLNTHRQTDTNNTSIFSLDVVNLYPNVPVDKGVGMIMKTLREHISELNLYGLNEKSFLDILKFVCKNYYVTFNDKTYLQTSGVPMGARFAPPFAIIMMHHNETAAIKRVEEKGVNVVFYGRYIDDILFIADAQANVDTPKVVLDTFNNNKDGVEFTLETMDKSSGLPFLDTTINIDNHNKRISYCWYMKDLHSGNVLKADAFAPFKTKSNFVRNRFENIMYSCNNTDDLNKSIMKMSNILINNNYSQEQIKHGIGDALKRFNDKNRTPRNKNEFSDKLKTHTLLKIPNMGNTFNKDIETIGANNGFNLVVINGRSRRVKDLARPKKSNDYCKKETCLVCTHLVESKHYCGTTNVVYRYTCGDCGAEYIGKTDDTISNRFYQHRMAVNRQDYRSPLVRHYNETHNTSTNTHTNNTNTDNNNRTTISDWRFDVLKRCTGNPVDTALDEADFIEKKNPAVNKKRELRTLFESK